MESATKQRLVGAVVLVGAIAWIVPVFLDGPANDPQTISETVELPGIEVADTERHQIELPRAGEPQPQPEREPVAMPTPGQQSESHESARDTDAPTPNEQVVAEDASPSVSTPPQRQDPPPVSAIDPVQDQPTQSVSQSREVANREPPPAPARPASDPNDDGLFAVQLGSFSSRENASALARDLRATGIAAFLTEVKTATGSMHRVRIGPVESRSAAEKLQGELSAKGHDGQVVSHP